ncbi:alpha/beta hydrolase [Pseudomonas sp. sp1636]|uniref:alpha/beta hydrolase n=1 Tax=Pseudomonas sp. sp1636 TaxID=3036707 RepID=UPI0025A6137A|nr:alpha/beta hydrolase [Pseudomonas sp. sp1636]MDM8347624.1 alpha/beta hydrolase [Pseudomonas sp. sp1636]
MLATLNGCASPAARLEELARQQDHRLASLPTSQFDLQVALPNAPQPDSRLRVYLEGDGRAWITATQPSLDPTPDDLLLARLALSDPRPSVYLARPCQFVRSPGCAPQYWTQRRFSQEIVASLSEALDQLQRRHGNRDFELIGYSGGGALALLLAAARDDIAQVQTLAGNLSPRRWAQRLELEPLHGSLEPLDFAERLRALPQRHLAGSDDQVMPASVLEEYAAHLGSADCLELQRLAGVDHHAGWLERWRHWRNRPIECKTTRRQANGRAERHRAGSP